MIYWIQKVAFWGIKYFDIHINEKIGSEFIFVVKLLIIRYRYCETHYLI